MKKVLAILIVLLLTVSLFACKDETPAAQSPAGDSSASSPAAESPAAQSPSAPSSGGGSSFVFPPHGPVGWYSDDVDWFARPAYKIAFIYDNASATTDLLDQALQSWSSRVNFEYTSFNANSNADSFINTMGVLAQQGYTGMVLNPDATYIDRVKVAAEEHKINWLPGFVPLLDENGNPMCAQESLGVKYQADLMMDWLHDVYRDYLGDIDTSKLGLISTSQSVVPVLKAVSDFCIQIFQERYPEAAANAFEVDTVAFGFDANAGYNSAAPFIAAHPEVEYWFVVGSIEDVVQGACRAIDAAGLTDKTVAISCAANLLMASWKSGTDTGCYKAGVYYSMEIYMEPIVCGVIAMLDGRATQETLWPEWKDPNQQYPVVTNASTILTVANYASYDAYVDQYLEAIANGQTPPKPPADR